MCWITKVEGGGGLAPSSCCVFVGRFVFMSSLLRLNPLNFLQLLLNAPSLATLVFVHPAWWLLSHEAHCEAGR